MASRANPHLSIIEPLCFHKIHGDQIRLSERDTRATRERLTNTILFTNRPILPAEIVQFQIEELSSDFYGSMRIGLTTIDPDSYTQQTVPKSTQEITSGECFMPAVNRHPNIKKNNVIRMRYTSEGDISFDYDGTGFSKALTVSPISKDVWCCLDLNGIVAQIRIVQTETRVSSNPVERSLERLTQYTTNRNEKTAIFYGDRLKSGTVSLENCDENSELTYNIAVKRYSPASMIIDESLLRSMYVVLQILDMDHTLSGYFTVRCLTNGHSSNDHTKFIDSSIDHIKIGDEIGLRITREGRLAFSCNNRRVKPLFNIDISVNDDPNPQKTTFQLEILMNGRVTGLRLIGIYQPTAEETRPPPAAGGGCQATVRSRVCPNGLSGLLLPCKHLCVCFDCGQLLVNKHPCPNVNCRKQVTGCMKVYKN